MTLVPKGYIVFPDTHGHFHEVMTALDGLKRRGLLEERQLVFLGDYIDRGREIRELLDLTVGLQRQGHIFIAGNHEYTLRMALDEDIPDHEAWVRRWATRYEDQTLCCYGVSAPSSILGLSSKLWERYLQELRQNMPQEHQDFLRSLPLYYETDEHIFVHAGLTQEPWETQRQLLDHPWTVEDGGPSQVFSSILAQTTRHGAAKIVVSGHVAHRNVTIGRNRIRLHCGVEVGGPLMVWVSDLDSFFRVPPRIKRTR